MIETKLIPAFNDNYLFLVTFNDGSTGVVDPGDAAPVMAELKRQGKSLDYILITHHHNDHIGGVNQLRAAYPNAQIIGNTHDETRLPALDKKVQGCDEFTIGGTTIKVIETSGHTVGHICYYIAGSKTVFVGDTMFVMGCGRLFEGTAEQMFTALNKLAALPDDTNIYCAHEYTIANAEFARHAFPDNDDIRAALRNAKDLRRQNIPTVPSTIKAEKQTNPFLLAQSADEFAMLRHSKDNF